MSESQREQLPNAEQKLRTKSGGSSKRGGNANTPQHHINHIRRKTCHLKRRNTTPQNALLWAERDSKKLKKHTG